MILTYNVIHSGIQMETVQSPMQIAQQRTERIQSVSFWVIPAPPPPPPLESMVQAHVLIIRF